MTPEVHEHYKKDENENHEPGGVTFSELIPLPKLTGIQTATQQETAFRDIYIHSEKNNERREETTK